MTTKYITTYIAGGYLIAPGVYEVIVTHTGGVGRTGIVGGEGYKTVVNEGLINNTYRGFGGRYAGIYLETGGRVTNGSAAYPDATIKGEYGLLLTGRAAVTNLGSIEGLGDVYTGAKAIGVELSLGTVTNGSAVDRTALIEGANYGVLIVPDGGVVVNYGSIESQSGFAIDITGGGSVTNGASGAPEGTILGSVGVAITGGPGTVANFGTIEGVGQAGAGVTLAAGGLVTNGSGADTTALISGDEGVNIGGAAAGTVNNYGTIEGLGGAYDASVTISGPGRVFNGVAGLIEGGEGVALGGGGVVRNDGTIRGEANLGHGGTGVFLSNGADLYNGAASDRSALISGDYGVFSQGSGTVDNLGTISGDYHSAGVELYNGGSVTNGSVRNAAALITGYSGVRLAGAANLANFGTVAGIGGYGVSLFSAGESVTNGSAGHARASISGYQGVEVYSGAVTVNNFGTISGYGGTALSLYPGGSVFLEVEAGSVFQGAVLGNGASTLDVASGTGTLSALSGAAVTVSGSMAATTFSGFGTVEVGAGAVFTLTGAATLLAAQTLASAGALTASSSVTNGGVLESLGGTLIVSGAVTGSGKAVVDGGTLDFASSFNQAVTFMTKGTLELAQSQTYTASISGFSKIGNTSLDLVDIGFVSSAEATFSGTSTGGVLTVTDGTHTAKINLKGNYTTSTFIASSDGHGGTIVVDPKAKDLAVATAALSPHPLIAAMGAFGADMGVGWASQVNAATGQPLAPGLVAPRVALA